MGASPRSAVSPATGIAESDHDLRLYGVDNPAVEGPSAKRVGTCEAPPSESDGGAS